MTTRLLRFDRGAITAKLTRTPTGGVVVPANVSRSGVLVYRQPDGSTVREYRPDAENDRALVTLEDAIVTVGHPPGNVTPDTAKHYSVGHAKRPRRDGRFVAADLAIVDGPTIRRIDAADLVEVSAGYLCRLEMTPGVSPAGEHYDAIQRDVAFNHVALLKRGEGRAGPDVRLRLDAAIEIDSVRADRIEAVLRLAPGFRTRAQLEAMSDDALAGTYDGTLAGQGRADGGGAQPLTETERARLVSGGGLGRSWNPWDLSRR